MGIVTTNVELMSQGGEPRVEVLKALVDTGATLSIFPGSLLDSLSVERLTRVTARVADGRRITRDVGDVRMRVDGQAVWARVIFGETEDPTILGLTVLEQLGLSVDPVARRLVPAEFILF